MSFARSANGVRFPLAARCLIGRSPIADWMLLDSNVSYEHASLWWDGQGWWVRDLGSQNGTKLDGTTVPSGVKTRISQGQQLTVGDTRFDLVDLSPPDALARDLVAREWITAQAGLLVLPSHDDPELTLFRGLDDLWRAETDQDTSFPIEQQVVVVGGRAFRVSLPLLAKGTTIMEAAPLLEDIRLELRHSADMEHIEAYAHAGPKRLDLGARAHNYLLLVLAQRRLTDAENGVPESDCGWVYQDELERMLNANRKTLNLHVFRVRKALCDVHIDGGASVIERRSGNNQLRLGVSDITVVAL